MSSTQQTLCKQISALEHANQELARALHEVQAETRAKSLFIADMGHELRSPLTAVMGFSEMIGEEVELHGLTEVADDTHRILQAGHMLLNTINNIVCLAKLEIGALAPALTRVPIDEIIQDVADNLRELMQKRRSAIELHIASDLPKMRTDPEWAGAILDNILHNAARYTRQNPITLTAACEHTPSHDWLVVHIGGANVGVPPAALNTLFNQPPPENTSERYKHNNITLELLVSRGYCRALGGDMTITHENTGTTDFAIRLPLEAEDGIRPVLTFHTPPPD